MPSTLQPTRMDRLKTAKTKLYSVNPSATVTSGTALNTRQMLGIDPPRRGSYLLTVVITAAVSFAAGYRYVTVKTKPGPTSETLTATTDEAVSSLALQRDNKGNSPESRLENSSKSAADSFQPKLAMSLSVKDESATPQTSLKAGRFAVDSATLTTATQTMLDGWAERLKNNSSMRVKISGHADDRGSLRYNDSLAKDRANVARRYLLAKGAKHYQIETASFGKRRPLIAGNDESAWAQNRRIELVELKKTSKKSTKNAVTSKNNGKNSVKNEAKLANHTSKPNNAKN